MTVAVKLLELENVLKDKSLMADIKGILSASYEDPEDIIENFFPLNDNVYLGYDLDEDRNILFA